MRAHIHARVIVRTLVILLTACGGGGGGEEEAGPTIISVTVSAAKLLPGQSVTVTAIVVAEDEMMPVVSGQLVRGTLNLGTFERLTVQETGAQTFEATTTWEQLAGSDLGGKMGGTVPAPITVRFFDSTGEFRERAASVELGCPETTGAVCGGACVDASVQSANCGGCGQTCGANVGTVSTTCRQGKCGLATDLMETRQSCDAACASLTFSGSPMQCEQFCRVDGINMNYAQGGAAGTSWYMDTPHTRSSFGELDTCGTTPPPRVDDLDFKYLRCCCTATF